LGPSQGDQIGRIFADWAIVFFEQFFKVGDIFWPFFPCKKWPKNVDIDQ
jgi:hypothetical protein